jgi:hypothetical protein
MSGIFKELTKRFRQQVLRDYGLMCTGIPYHVDLLKHLCRVAFDVIDPFELYAALHDR